MSVRIKNLGKFKGSNGEVYEVIEEIKQIPQRTLSGPAVMRDGMKGYITSCGIPLNLNDGIFITLDDIILTKV